jgi:branched-chain amino acid transport system substrate-binding protein
MASYARPGRCHAPIWRLGVAPLARLRTAILCCFSLLFAPLGLAQDDPPSQVPPHFDARRQRTEYTGPAKPALSPDQVDEVRIGYFAPSDPEDPLCGNMWRAAQAAVNDANREGGLQGKPFRLVPAWSKDPWGTGVKQLTKLVYRDRVWAIVGGADGPSTHLAEQVVAKARLPLISPVSTDKTVNLANVPWMFSLAPSDHLVAEAMAPSLARHLGDQPLVILSSNDHDSFLLTRELRKALDQHGVVPDFQYEFHSSEGPYAELGRRTVAARPGAVVVVADVLDSVKLVRELRHRGYRQRIYGGPSMQRQLFLRQIGADGGEIVVPVLRSEPPETAAALQFHPSLPDDADFAALHTYDCVRLTIEAIRTAGLSRTAIGQALRDLSPWQGVSGSVNWDGLGGNRREVRLGMLRENQVVALERDD